MYVYEEAIKRAYEEAKKSIELICDMNDTLMTIEFMKTIIRSRLERPYEKQKFEECYEILEDYSLIDKRMRSIEFECTNCDYEGAGLYFIGMCSFNPKTHEKYYLVKVGSTGNVKRRLRQYLGMNPMIYNNNCILPLRNKTGEQIGYYEANCHEFLEKNAFAKAANANEWYYVTEDKYFELCDLFANTEKFIQIAIG